MDALELRRLLRQTLEDRRLSGGERRALREVLDEAATDDATRARLRHEAFELACEAVDEPRSREVLDWLEEVIKTLLPRASAAAAPAVEHTSEAHFSPGPACTSRVQALLRGARRSLRLCIFTLTDDRLADAVLDAQRRGIAVRLISDNDKAHDLGADTLRLRDAGVPVRLDPVPDHMHHKFAVVDDALLLTGSFNWTRSAGDRNQENLVVTADPRLVAAFVREFEKLWRQFGG